LVLTEHKPLEAGETPKLEKAPTGISGLDEVLLGGLPMGRPSLLCGAAGSGKTLIAMTFLVNGAIRYGDAGVFMSFEERSEGLASNVASLGYDLDALIAEKSLVIDHVRIENGGHWSVDRSHRSRFQQPTHDYRRQP
jgi:circadian clock protein KaiC